MFNFIKSSKFKIVSVLLLVFIIVILIIGNFANEPVHSINLPSMDKYQTTTHILISDVVEPYAFADNLGNPTGYDVEMLYLMGDVMGTNIAVEFVDKEYALKSLNEGYISGILSDDCQNNSELLSIATPIKHDDNVAFFGRTRINNFNTIRQHNIATVGDTERYRTVVNLYGLQNTINIYPTYDMAFQSVIDGDNDYVISSYPAGVRLLSKLNNTDIKNILELPISQSMCISTTNDNVQLIDRLNNAYVVLVTSGKIDELNHKWLNSYVFGENVVDHLYRFRYFIMVALFTLLIVWILIATKNILSLKKTINVVHEERKVDREAIDYYELLSKYLRSSFDSVIEVNVTNNEILDKVSQKASKKICGVDYTPTFSQVIDMLVKHYIHDDSKDKFNNIFKRDNLITMYSENKSRATIDIQMRGRINVGKWKRITLNIFKYQSDDSVRMLCVIENIDAEKRLTEKAVRDSMTRLYNKTATSEMITDIIRQSDPTQSIHAFFVLDIDDFKNVNDSCGHAFGDRVIIMFASALKRHFRDTDIMGRIGGDEFVLFCRDIPSIEWLKNKAQSLCETLNTTVEYDGKQHTTSASIGISIYSKHGMTFDQLYKSADSALYVTKSLGKKGYTILSDNDAVNTDKV